MFGHLSDRSKTESTKGGEFQAVTHERQANQGRLPFGVSGKCSWIKHQPSSIEQQVASIKHFPSNIEAKNQKSDKQRVYCLMIDHSNIDRILVGPQNLKKSSASGPTGKFLMTCGGMYANVRNPPSNTQQSQTPPLSHSTRPRPNLPCPAPQTTGHITT